jgi:glutathione synthase/RimK-type ligase-like ATP-grasp enzyme
MNASMKTSSHPILIIGPHDDLHVSEVQHRLEDMSQEYRLLDVGLFPEDEKISLGEAVDAVYFGDEHFVPACVYVRNLGFNPIDIEKEGSSRRQFASVTYREQSEFILSLVYRWEKLGVPIYNPPSARYRVTKPFQLALLEEAGLPVPDSLWSNDPEKVREFAKGRRAVYKPVAGGATTKELTAEDLTAERLKHLATAPVTFQTLLPGDDIRVYVLDGEIIASYRIVTKALDFRQNEEAIESIQLSSEVQNQCLSAVETIGLRFTGMDLKGDSNGVLRFLELNPSPMFLGFDKRAGTDILGCLVNTLVNHTNHTI